MPIETLSPFAENPAAILSLGGFAIGLVFGAIVLTTNFCTMGAVVNVKYLESHI
jgi:hypothetical protein